MHNRRVMVIHVLNALIILKVPNLYIRLTNSDQDIFPRHNIDHTNSSPMSLINNAEFTFKYINQVNIGVFRAKEEHLTTARQP